MREILFRGKRIDNGEWVEGKNIFWDTENRVNIVPTGELCFLATHHETLQEVLILPRVEVDPETVGQYTGLTDKNGTKIFEGDICRNTQNGEIVSVKWHGTMAGYVWSKPKDQSHNLFEFGELFRAYDKYEVIGNIHDNPELLKGGDEK